MELRDRTVAVTGASGMVGRYLVRALVDRGARAVAVVRDPSKLTASESIDVRRADLSDVDALSAAFDGCDAIFSNAGVVSIGGHSREALMRANVEGTRNVLEAMRRVGARRVVMTSSVTAYAPRRGRVYEEDDPLWDASARVSRPRYYAVSKALAEREARRLADAHAIDLSVARPSGIYGLHDRTGFTVWLRRFTAMPLVTVFPTHLYMPNVYAGDLAEAMVRMLERPSASGRAYNVSGDPDVSFWHMLDAYRAAGWAAPPIVIPIPVPFRRAYAIDRARADLDFENTPPLDAFTEMRAHAAAG
ncbi:MAG: NAD-dependent epimerase/dehydratase family protein [Sandaracinaceae bacterium]